MESFSVKCTIESQSPLLHANGGIKQLTLALKKDGNPLSVSLSSRISSECQTFADQRKVAFHFLVSGPLLDSDSGIYQCHAFVGNDSLHGKVPVEIKDSDGHNILVLNGHPAKLDCSSHALVSARYWIDPKDEEPAGRKEGAFLHIQNVTCNGQGEYKCILILANSTVVVKKYMINVVEEINLYETSKHVVITWLICSPFSTTTVTCRNKDESFSFDVIKNRTLWHSEWTKLNFKTLFCKEGLSCSVQGLNIRSRFRRFCIEENTEAPENLESSFNLRIYIFVSVGLSILVAVEVITVILLRLIAHNRRKRESSSGHLSPSFTRDFSIQVQLETNDILSDHGYKPESLCNKQKRMQVYETSL
eukprot:m.29763 g.29763  ORF g.29763 m.29763 type:complete len:362 (+) comp31227_c0_seq1:392-1477(+)